MVVLRLRRAIFSNIHTKTSKMNLIKMISNFAAFFLIIATRSIQSLPTSTPSTILTNPCGGQDSGLTITDEEFYEHLGQLIPQASSLQQKTNQLKQIMGEERIQSSFFRKFYERKCRMDFPDTVFPNMDEPLLTDDTFPQVYTNVSMLAIYYNQILVEEANYDDDTNVKVLLQDIITVANQLRCSNQVILKYYQVDIPEIHFVIPENKINEENHAKRYGIHYQIAHMSGLYSGSLVILFEEL